MAIIEIGKAANTVAPIVGAGAAPASVDHAAGFLNIMREVNNFVNSPLIKSIIERKLGIGADQQNTGFSGKNPTGTQSNVVNNPTDAPVQQQQIVESQKIDYTKMFLELMNTEKGRNDMIEGLGILKNYVGDLTISQLQDSIKQVGEKDVQSTK